MKNVQLGLALLILAGIAVFVPSCKKDATKKMVITSIGDTTGATLIGFVYDASGKMIRINESGTVIDFFYNGDKLVSRSTSSSGTVQSVDSFRYDSQNRIIQVDNYSAGLSLLIKSSSFTYNGDNTINSATVDYVSPGSNDELYNYTYTSGKLTKREDFVKPATTFKKSSQTEFLAYDNNQSPFNAISQKYLIDFFSTAIFFYQYPNNFTSFKQTSYDTSTGDVTTQQSGSATYDYNSSNLPTKLKFNQGASSGIYVFGYEEI